MDGEIVNYLSSENIFKMIMKLKDKKFYQWINKHPIISIMVLILMAVFILYRFVTFILKYLV